MKKTLYKHLFLLLAIILAGTGQAFADGTDGFDKGDANGDKSVDVSDAVVVNDKFHHPNNDINCPLNADANGDGVIDVSDAVVIIAMFHYGGISANGTIVGWTEGNSSSEQEDQDLEEGDFGD